MMLDINCTAKKVAHTPKIVYDSICRRYGYRHILGREENNEGKILRKANKTDRTSRR